MKNFDSGRCRLYSKALSSYNYIFVYILAIAGQTARPNWLKLFEETNGHPLIGVT